MRKVGNVVAVGAVLLGAIAYGQTTIVVDWAGNGDYLTIQEGIDAAVDGDTIVVEPSTGSPAGAYVESLWVPAKEITLRSTDPDDPAVVAATVMDGGAGGAVIAFAYGTTRDTVLDGFTITNGLTGTGAGVRCFYADPTIRRCTIIGNEAGSQGGGICCYQGSPRVDRCAIVGNTADQDGGMAILLNSNPVVTNCVFIGNYADGCSD